MVHGECITIGLVPQVCGVRDDAEYPERPAGMQLTQFVHLSALLRGDVAGADFLVMHLRPWPSTLPPAPQWPDLTSCLPQIEQHFGAPVYRDDDIEVFALSPAGKISLR